MNYPVRVAARIYIPPTPPVAHAHGQRYFDYHRYFVFGFSEKDLEYRKKIYTDNNGFKDDPEGLERHEEEDNRIVICYETDYWFDITSFYRK